MLSDDDITSENNCKLHAFVLNRACDASKDAEYH